MNEKTMPHHFAEDLEVCLERGTTSGAAGKPREYTELLKLGLALSRADLDEEKHREAVKRKAMPQEHGSRTSLQGRSRSRFRKTGGMLAASCLVAVLLLAPTSFARDWAGRIISTISLGHISVSQVERPADVGEIMPEELKGKLFTKNGEPVTEWNGRQEPFYTADGEEIAGFTDGKIVTKKEMKASENSAIRITDPAQIGTYIVFQAGLPGYLPEGFAFDRAEVYEAGNKYLNVYYTNPATGGLIFIQERMADEETAYATSTEEKVQKAKVGGVEAIITGNRSIDWEIDGVLYSIMTGKSGIKLEGQDLIRMAESMK